MNEYYEIEGNCPSGSFVYTIKSGDTLFKLAMTYNTTVEAIMAINPGINPNNLQIGQRICIPQTSPPPTRCPMGTFAYTIKAGDTLYMLAIRYNTTVEAIIAVNPGINPNNLQIGQVICIPETTPPPPRCPVGTFAYVIKAGDTLYMLAIRYNTTVQAIMAVNPGIDPNNLQIGQIICIPEVMPPTRCPMGTFEYTIKAGDTLYMLAIRYNTTVQAITAVNPGIDPNNLQIGQIICIPEVIPPTRCPMGTFEYTIKAGDTLYMLAIRYNTTVQAILAVNPGLDPNNLQIGQIICIPRTVTPPDCDGMFYVVRPGDTLYSIANMFDVPLASLIAANPGVDPNNLMVGQLICIPSCEPPIFCPGGTKYVVRVNDTLSSILLRFNISVMDLMAGNPNVNLDRLVVGQQLCILPHKDRGCPCPTGTKSYVIVPADVPQSGMVLEALAKKFNTTVSTLLRINSNLAPSDFKAGVRICIPSI